jgi:hypothetical protein
MLPPSSGQNSHIFLDIAAAHWYERYATGESPKAVLFVILYN